MHELLAVRDWLKALGTLCAGSMSTRDAQAKLATYVPMLAHEFPNAAFTAASLAAVGRACKFFPSFGELATALSAWWEDNRPYEPTPLRLTGPAVGIDRVDIPKPRDPPTEAELAAVDEIMRQWRMQIGYGKSRPLESEAAPESKLLPPAALLATYERLAAEGDTAAAIRVALLRRKIAERATQEATP
jgi:hypothetical protein